MTDEQLLREERIWQMVMRRVRWVTVVLTFLAAIAANIFVVGWYASGTYARLAAVENLSANNVKRISAMESRQYKAENGYARVDERLIAIQRTQERIERLMDMLARNQGVYAPRPAPQ